MREHGRRVHRRIAALVVTLIVVGVALAGMGSATALPRPSQFVIIKFIPSLHEVTMTIPTPACKHGPPGCVWRLWVDEPFAPGAPVLGSAIGTSGTVTVTYPSTVCGTVQGDASVTLQADASVGGQFWRFKVGHRTAIPCPPTTPNVHPPPPATPPVAATTPTRGAPDPTGAAATPVPVAGVASTSTPATASPAKAVETAAISQLPFTGIDLTPMALIGMALVLGGLLLATGLEQRRRIRHRLHSTARWFLGE
jgi:hypothetical protein